MKRKIKVVNDQTFGFYLIRHMKELCEKMNMDIFSGWFVTNIIIPYKREDNMCEWVCEMIGFKKVATIDKIYYRLKEVELIA
jgi:hypothetical protein